MIRLPFKISFPKIKRTPQSCLGVDIGTALIKIVDLGKSGGRIKLENYGDTSAKTLYEKQFRTFEENALSLSTSEIAEAIKAILAEAKIQRKDAVFSIPDFSSFFTTFELPAMTKEELPQAVQFAAPQHIPLPLSEVTTDWQIVEGNIKDKKRGNLKILLVAVPNEVIYQYREIAKTSNLEIQGLEAEAFSLSRAVMKNIDEKDLKSTISIIDIGAQSTTCSIIDKGTLKLSHSFDIAGNELTQTLAKGLGINYEEAEELKKKYGLKFLSEASNEENPKKVARTLATVIDSILIETERILQGFSQLENKKIQKIILAGGTVLIPGLREYFSSHFKIEAEIINPFAKISYPPALEEDLKKIGPSYAIAVGSALRYLE